MHLIYIYLDGDLDIIDKNELDIIENQILRNYDIRDDFGDDGKEEISNIFFLLSNRIIKNNIINIIDLVKTKILNNIKIAITMNINHQ